MGSSSFLIDPGATSTVSLINATSWEKCCSLTQPVPTLVLQPWQRQSLVGVNGSLLHVKGSVSTPLNLGDHEFLMDLVVVETELEAFVRADNFQHQEGVWLLENHRSKQGNSGAIVARAMVTPNDRLVACVINPTGKPTMIHKGTKVAVLSQLSNTDINISSTTAEQSEEVSETKRAWLWEMACQAENATNAQREHLLLLSYADIFPEKDDDLGRTGIIKQQVPLHRLDNHLVSLHDTIRRKHLGCFNRCSRRKSLSHRQAHGLRQLFWDGSACFCIDYRQVNNLTRKDAYPLPRIDDTLDTLAGLKWFNTLDLLSGYWQVEVTDDDKEKTAFATHDGLFQFNVLPFGLCNGPATFQRLMDLVLAGLHWTNCLMYLNNVIVLGKDFEQHLSNLQQVFQRLQQANLKVKPAKCHLLKKEVHFLGHIVSEEGAVSTDPAKTDKVTSWPAPTTQ